MSYAFAQEEKHELSHLYETKIKNMGNAGRNGGEYYTPRPLIRAMIDVSTLRLERPYTMVLQALQASYVRPMTTSDSVRALQQ